MNKYAFILLLFLCSITSVFAQLKSYSFEKAEQLSKENPRPFVVFIHTSWCKYCQLMHNTTFKDQGIINVLNSDFYFISLDAEVEDDVVFHNRKFKFQATGPSSGINELAVELGTIDDQLVYPTVTILDMDNDILYQKASYQKATTLMAVLIKNRNHK